MRTAELLLFFLLVCQTTESLRDNRVNLGENVTLDCQIDDKDIYWVFQKLTDSPVLIMRTFTSHSTTSQFTDDRFKNKYSLLTLSRLFISNITIDELGIYYCVKAAPLRISNGTRLYITDHNQTENKNQSQPHCEKTTKIDNNLTVTSFILNIVLIVAIIGLLILKLKKLQKNQQSRPSAARGLQRHTGLLLIKLQACKKTHQQYQDEELEFYRTNDEEFSEVEFCLSRPTNNTFGKNPRQT